jgi:peptidoglycan hydrolase-like protein with peptidoglycan-binding domain
MGAKPSRSRAPLITALVFAVAVVAGAIGWALAVVFSGPEDVLEERSFTTVQVTEGEVGSSITLNTAAEWTPVPVGSNRAAGTVTSVDVTPGDEVAAGSVLYTVDLRPVVIAQGEVPAFRDLTDGASGADVSQLQTLLQGLGFYKGSVDGVFGPGVGAAVRAWQESLGLEPSGVVRAGDVMFVPALPVRVVFDPAVLTRGAQLNGGEPVLSGLPSSPGFMIPITEAQAPLIPSGTRVLITGPNGEEWAAGAGEQTSGEGGAVMVALEGVDGALICAKECAALPVTGPSRLRSEVVTVDQVQGLTVPTAALRSGADGATVVVDEAGRELPVTIITSAKGMSVIEGVEPGLEVRVPATGPEG